MTCLKKKELCYNYNSLLSVGMVVFCYSGKRKGCSIFGVSLHDGRVIRDGGYESVFHREHYSSDRILTCQNVLRKYLRWWKTLFFHLIDVAVVNSFILFKVHQTQFRDKEALRRPSSYDLIKFREEIVRQLCGLRW